MTIQSKQALLPIFWSKLKKYSHVYLPLFFLLLPCLAYVYNLGYFWSLDLQLLGFLKLNDYYEGTIPYFFYFTFLSIFYYIGAVEFSKNLSLLKILIFIKESFKLMGETISSTCLILCLYMKVIIAGCRLYFAQNSLSIKKIKSEREEARKKLNTLFSYHILNQIISWGKRLLLCILVIFSFVCILFTILRSLAITSWSSTLICSLVFLCLNDILKNDLGLKWIIHIIIVPLMIFIIGFNTEKMDYNKKKNYLYFINENTPFYLIRSISNGYIVHNNQNICFFPRESLIRMEVRIPKEEDTK